MKLIPTYSFTKEEIKKFKNRSGIYALAYQKEIFYVGQSVNLGERLSKHRSENAFESTIKDIIRSDGKTNLCKTLAMYNFINEHREDIYFMILAETPLEELDTTEEHYITLYKPRYNYKGVDVPYTPARKNSTFKSEKNTL